MLAMAAMAPVGVWAQVDSQPAEGRERRALLQRFDRDGDGKLSAAERQTAQKELRAGRGEKAARRVLPAGVKSVLDVEYARVDGRPLRLDLYLPREPSGLLPVIVFIHGGAWRSGDKSTCPIVHLAAEGYGVVSIDYRLTDKAVFPAQIHDCKGAIRWVRANANKYGFDPDRIGAWGSSAGGHLVALLGTSGGVKELEGDVGGNLQYSSRVQAVADFCGPSSFRLEDIEGIEGVKKGATPPALVALLGGTVEEKAGLARLASPTTFVTPDDPPFFIAHGEQDRVVPVNQARILADALKKTGVETTLHIDPKADHGVGKPEIRKRAEEFFHKHLKAGRARSAPAPR